jgi:hypothetical protein
VIPGEAIIAKVGSKLRIVSKVGKDTRAGRYSTKIDSKVSVVPQKVLTKALSETFMDGTYRTVITNEDIVVYRVFGGRAEAGGRFTTTNQAVSKIDSKIDLALLPEWGNSLRYEAKIVIPKGTEINIGKAASQTIESTGTKLAGGADQVLLPKDWPY